MKEYFRKKLVYMKRHPQIIPMILIIICCCIYTFKLSVHSNATMYVNNKIIAFNLFITTLASIMAVFTFIAVKKVNKKAIPVILLTAVLLILQLGLDIYYLNILNYEITVKEVPKIADISSSIIWSYVHIIALILTLISIFLLPLYSKWLQRINTTKQEQIIQEKLSYDKIEIEYENE